MTIQQGHLLIDIGNSALKYSFYEDLSQDNISGFKHGNFEVTEWLNQVNSQKRINQISLSNVYKQKLEDDIAQWCKAHHTSFFCARSEANSQGLNNGYEIPSQLGVDRWLAMLFAWQRFKKDCFVISCGTATTFDAINSQGQHLGGLIMPGLKRMKEALSVDTEQIEYVKNYKPVSLSLARNTAQAVAHAAIFATSGFLEKGIEVSGMQASSGVITGGWAESLIPHLRDNIIYEKSAVLQGLALQSSRSNHW